MVTRQLEVDQAVNRESSPVKDQRSTTAPRNQQSSNPQDQDQDQDIKSRDQDQDIEQNCLKTLLRQDTVLRLTVMNYGALGHVPPLALAHVGPYTNLSIFNYTHLQWGVLDW